MTDNSFDKFIKEKLNGYSSPVQPEMWNKVRPGKNGRRYAFPVKRLIVALIIATCLSSIGYLTWKTNETASKVVKKEAGINKGFSKKSENQNISQHSTIPITENVKRPDQPIVKTNKAAQKISNEKNTSAKDYTQISDQHIKNNRLYGSNQNNKSSYASRFNISIPLQSIDKNAAINWNTYYHPLSDVKSLLAISQKSTLLQQGQLTKQLKYSKLLCVVDCPLAKRDYTSVKPRHKSGLYLEIFASPDYITKQVTPNANLNPAYLNRKDSSETASSSFTAGLRLSKSFGSIAVKTGLQYSQVNETFRYRSENEKRLTTVVTLHTIVRSPGDTLQIRDTSSFEQTGYRNKISNNRYVSVDIPLLLGYEWNNEKWRAGVTAGIILNLYSQQTGRLLDTAYVPVAFGKDNTIFKKNMGLGLYAGLSLAKVMRNGTEIFAEPYFRYKVGYMTKSDNPFNQKFNVAGINLGVRYKLFLSGQRYYSR